MDKIWVNDLYEHLGQADVVSSFLVSEKSLREGKRGMYLRMRLMDKTGDVAANVWNNASALDKLFEKGDVIKVKGVVSKFKEQIQLTVNKIRKMGEEEFSLPDYLRSTDKDLNSLMDDLYEFIDSVESVQLKQLLTIIFEDQEFLANFKKCPAAKNWHHNYIGGLLEHTISVTKICAFAAELYPVDKDILVAGAILHDIGKVFEYEVSSVIDFTDEGRLIGHLCIGDDFVTQKAREIPDFDLRTLMKIRHLILAHHGEMEKGAARLPQTLEAMVLHYADNMDAQAVGISQLISSVQQNDARWTEYNAIHNRYFYIG